MPKRETRTTEIVHKWAIEQFLEWERKAANPERKGKYEVAPKSAIFMNLEAENRETTLI